MGAERSVQDMRPDISPCLSLLCAFSLRCLACLTSRGSKQTTRAALVMHTPSGGALVMDDAVLCSLCSVLLSVESGCRC